MRHGVCVCMCVCGAVLCWGGGVVEPPSPLPAQPPLVATPALVPCPPGALPPWCPAPSVDRIQANPSRGPVVLLRRVRGPGRCARDPRARTRTRWSARTRSRCCPTSRSQWLVVHAVCRLALSPSPPSPTLRLHAFPRLPQVGPVLFAFLAVYFGFHASWKTALAVGAAIAPTSFGFSAGLFMEAGHMHTSLAVIAW